MSYMPTKKYYMAAFRSLPKDSRINSALILSSYVAQILIAIAIGNYMLNAGVEYRFFFVALLAFFIGTRIRGINNILHECSHLNFTEKMMDNVVFGRIVAALLLKTYEAYKAEHMSHHAHLGDYEKDLDFHHHEKFRFEEELTPKTLARHIMTPILGLHLPSYFSVDLSDRDGPIYTALKGLVLAAAAVYLFIDPVAALLLVVVPFAWIYPALNYWTDCIDHGGIMESDDELKQSRNVVVNPVLRFIFFPRNDCYHLIHHLFPGVPVNHFDQVHKQLLEDPHYREVAEPRVATAASLVPEV